MITVLRWILFPFSLIYHSIIWVRNLMYDKQVIQSKSFAIPTIVIGNLAIGGTGKSPMTEYLIRLLKDKYKIATLSRGYGRKSKGFKIVETNSKATEVGDEPLQFKRKFPSITVVVNENRCEGVEKLQPNHDIIILDDAFQHRKLKAGYAILLFDYQSLFKPIVVLPTGNFRDIFSSSKRADLIIITKCPDYLSVNDKNHIEHSLRKHSCAPIFYTKIGYDIPINTNGQYLTDKLENKEIILFCGIANPTPLVNYLEKGGNVVQLIQYPDHHNYNTSDFDKVKSIFKATKKSNKLILTTEKDIQRVDNDIFKDYPLYYIPIHLQAVDAQQFNFDSHIEKYISKNLD